MYIVDRTILSEATAIADDDFKVVTQLAQIEYVSMMLGTMADPIFEYEKGKFATGKNAMDKMRKMYAGN